MYGLKPSSWLTSNIAAFESALPVRTNLISGCSRNTRSSMGRLEPAPQAVIAILGKDPGFHLLKNLGTIRIPLLTWVKPANLPVAFSRMYITHR